MNLFDQFPDYELVTIKDPTLDEISMFIRHKPTKLESRSIRIDGLRRIAAYDLAAMLCEELAEQIEAANKLPTHLL